MSDDQDEVIMIGCGDTAGPNSFITFKESEEERDYKVTINEFEKKKQSFLSSEVQIYKIDISSTNRDDMVINRRFSDMEFLFDILKERHPGVILPGFPENTVYSFIQAKLNIWDKDAFIGKRMQTLERFLQKLLNMKSLAGCEELVNFLGPDEQFEIFKQSHVTSLKKKGILNSAIQTASSYFKTKRVDSKYEKIMEAGQNVAKQLEKLFHSVQTYIDLNRQELRLNASLHQEGIDISKDAIAKQFFDKWDAILEATTRDLIKVVDLVYFGLLDLRVFLSIIERRYELKEENQTQQVEILQKTFEAQKDAFLEEKTKELLENKDIFKQIIKQQTRKPE